MPTLLNDRYQIFRHLSEGGENVVYVASDSQSQPPGQEVVIKRRKHSFEGRIKKPGSESPAGPGPTLKLDRPTN